VRRKLAILVAVLLSPALLVPTFYVYSRHVPYSIEARDRPATSATDGGLQVRYLGVTGYEITDGTTVVLLDPTPTRPTPTTLLTEHLVPDEAYGKEICPRADFILVNHTHYDHVLDVPAIAVRTGAKVLGSQSTINLARSRGVAADKVQRVQPGDRLTLGNFTVDVRRSRHTAIAGIDEPMAGTVPVDAGPLRFWRFGLDEALSFRFEANGASIWFHPTSTFEPGEVGGPPAGALIVGVTGEDPTPEKVKGILGEAKPRLVLPTHYDNFFQPMQRGLGLMPGLDLPAVRAMYLQAQPDLTWVVLDYGQTVQVPPDTR
jgi:L-ascorbate metabolism protein UlaG (beta-lactamase superfamily)